MHHVMHLVVAHHVMMAGHVMMLVHLFVHGRGLSGASRGGDKGENTGGGSGHENLRVSRRTLPARSGQGLLRSAR